MTTLRGVYIDGVVHLHHPLELANNTEVDVSLSPVDVHSDKQSERERIHAVFMADGLVKPRSFLNSTYPPLSPEHEAELAEKLAQAGPLSELIIKERAEQDDRLLL